MQYTEVMQRLRAMSDPEAVAGMARFGINPANTLGVSVPAIRSLAREMGRDHAVAQQLWVSGVHEARILASMVDDPREVTEAQMERWAKEFDSWDVCDQCCSNLFDKTRYAYQKAVEWSSREEEFVKRAAFALMAALAVHDKKADDAAFLRFLSLIERESGDSRNFVRKAVNWALRQIGKRNASLNRAAIGAAEEVQQQGAKSARWVASDALRELTSEKVQKRLASRLPASRGQQP
ncbi:MAG: DNA alkylation repair protein [Chloroflexi bacterium]|nr:DNA alkylation repair protein [Chloroflexota bacterium]